MSYDHPMDHDRAERRRDLVDDTVFSARKSGMVSYLLWTFLGSLGVHNFYLGRPKAGGLQLAGTLFVYCTYVSDDPGRWSASSPACRSASACSSIF